MGGTVSNTRFTVRSVKLMGAKLEQSVSRVFYFPQGKFLMNHQELNP